MQFFPVTVEQRRDALAKPVRFAVRTFVSFAALMALSYVITDGIWPDSAFGGPARTRLGFVVFWAAGMTMLTTLEARRRRRPRNATSLS